MKLYPIEYFLLLCVLLGIVGACLEPIWIPHLLVGSFIYLVDVGFSISVSRQAMKLNRSRLGWLILSLVISPIMTYALVRTLRFNPPPSRSMSDRTARLSA